MADPSKLALKGSCKIVTDYFEFAINSILFQRGIYPAEDFQTVRKYDLPLLVNVDDDVKDYILKIMLQIKKWIYGKKIVKLVLVIVSKTTVETVERWEFNININEENQSGDVPEKSRQETKKEIQAIIRQITSLVSYLPMLKDDDYTFNVMVYTDPNNPAHVPIEWLDTNGDQKMLEGDVEQVNFTSFSTDIHKVGTVVSYKVD
ncbi:DNA-binding protein [Suhomyces tanzawaensis NRRL Y-17324]|uniref:DNA-binding protein n=1 Tax=Suhomyces tanzawaensis NRRL Y-17324 TaxID=984487 RepID=A0A1E4SLL7_9ASCO|nr:DNA-binding protein [Suhomyces tanzawaensis NRRL Y-17324]ODV80390.1 DNA-binding protein [Suhomyces tanzawaensis NRRL Y-17324]